MAKKIEDTIKFVNNADNLMSFGKSFATLNGQPLDKDSIFDSKAKAEAFAKTASAYVGKIVVVVESKIVTAYVINSDNTLKPIGDKGSIESLEKLIKELQEKDVAHDASIKELGEKDVEIEGKITQLDTDYKAADTALSDRVTAVEGKFTEDAANNALQLGGKAASEYVLKTDKVAEANLDTALAKKINDKADTSTVNGINTRLEGVEGKFTEDAANNALQLGGQLPEHYATAESVTNLGSNKADKTEAIGTVSEVVDHANQISVKAVSGAGKDKTITINDVAHAVNADNLGNHAASEYQLAAELKALAKKDKVAETDLEDTLKTKINGKADAATVNAELAKKAVKTEVDAALKLKADKTYVDDQLALKATVVAQEATDKKAEQNKTDIARVEKEYKAADTALDTRLQAAEKSLKDVSTVMDFVGAVEKLPTGEELKKYQKGDVIVVTGGKEAGLEYVYDGTQFVEIGNSSSEQAAIADLQEKDKAHETSINALETNSATKTELSTLEGKVNKKAEQSALEAANGKITTLEGKVTTLEGKPANSITAEQVSSWDGEVGALAQANTNKQGLADLKAVVDNVDTGLAATKKIADDAASAAAAEKGALAKATANESALKTKVEQSTFDTLNKTVTDPSTGLVKKVGDLDTAVKTKAAQSDLEALQNKVNAEKTGLDSKASIEALNAVKATAEAAQTEEEVKALIGAAKIAQSQVTDLDTTLAGKENKGVAQDLINGLTGVVTGIPAADSTITALAQANGKVTATVSKIAIAQDQVTGLPEALAEKQTAAQVNELIQAATIEQNKVNGLPVALQALQAKDAELAGKITALEALKPAEAGAQVNKIESISVDGVALDIVEKAVALPKAMADSFGLVKGNAVENGVDVNNGLMSVHSLNVNKLVQSSDEELILDGGKAAK